MFASLTCVFRALPTSVTASLDKRKTHVLVLNLSLMLWGMLLPQPMRAAPSRPRRFGGVVLGGSSSSTSDLPLIRSHQRDMRNTMVTYVIGLRSFCSAQRAHRNPAGPTGLAGSVTRSSFHVLVFLAIRNGGCEKTRSRGGARAIRSSTPEPVLSSYGVPGPWLFCR